MADAKIQLSKIDPDEVVAVPSGFVGIFPGDDGNLYSKDGSSALKEIISVESPTTFGKSILSQADPAACRSTIGVAQGTERLAVSSLAVGGAGLAPATSLNIVSIGRNATGDLPDSTDYLGDSVFIGTNSGRKAKEGNGIVAIGNLSLATQVDMLHVVAIGDACLRFAENVFGGVSIGYVASTERINGTGFVQIGSYAGAYSTGGDYGVNIGYYSGAGTTGGSLGDDNLMIGGYSGMQCTGDHNYGIGWEVLYACLGNYNIGIGYQAGNGATSVNALENIFIGRRAGTDGQKTDAVNTIAIGAGAYTTANNQAVIGGPNNTEVVLTGTCKVTGTTITVGPVGYYGSVAMRSFDPGKIGYFEWLKPNGARHSYFGFDAGADVTFTNEQTNGRLALNCGLKIGSKTQSELPTASSFTGTIFIVTDSNTTTKGATIGGGGSNVVVAVSNGTNWIVV